MGRPKPKVEEYLEPYRPKVDKKRGHESHRFDRCQRLPSSRGHDGRRVG